MKSVKKAQKIRYLVDKYKNKEYTVSQENVTLCHVFGGETVTSLL